MKSRVVITGAGNISAVGVGTSDLWRGLASGYCGIRPISRFDTSQTGCKKAAQVSDFQVCDYVSHKGISCMSRAAQFVSTAAKLALREAEIGSLYFNGDEVGAVLGTTFGSANSMEAFDEECTRDGVRFVDPMSFPNTVTNSPAGYLSILVGAAGLNVTISTGFASGIDAIEYAARVLAEGQLRMVLAGGYDELSSISHLQMSGAGLLSHPNVTGVENSVPLDSNRNGFFPGEGAGIVILERLEDALAREAPILAELSGFGTSFCPSDSQAVESESQAMSGALMSAGLKPEDVGCVSASANGSLAGDKAERLSLEKVFAEQSSTIPVTAIKSMIGECGGAAGAIQIIVAALSTKFNAVPPTKGFEAGNPDSLLRKISPAEQAVDCNAVLVNGFNGRHNNSSAVVKKFSG